MVVFKSFKNSDYENVRQFLVELNANNKNHINWNWARFEWMFEHPEFDKSAIDSIGLWWDSEKVVGAAIYDMYFGEGFCGVLPEYENLYADVLDYAYDKLKDEGGFGLAICDDNAEKIKIAEKKGFVKAEQTESIMKLMLDNKLDYILPENLHIESFNPAENPYEFQWILWQGFDHGTDKAEFEKAEEIVPQKRPNLIEDLSVVVVNELGEKLAYCCVWYDKNTDYAYVEPVCTVPSYRGKGLAKAVVYEALNRARSMGAKSAYVISDMQFYRNLGFENDLHFTFYWKK